MPRKAFKDLTVDDVHSLVQDGESEGRELEFKRDLPAGTDEAKREWCADVTSLANTAGGTIYLGVDERAGVAVDVVGLSCTDPDKEIRRLEQVLSTGVDPRLPAVSLRAIVVPGKGAVIVAHVERSWRMPHLVKWGDSFRIFGRRNTGKFILDGTEIRSAFALSDRLPETIRRWRDERLAKIMAAEIPVVLESESMLVIHVMPVSAFASASFLSASEISESWLDFGTIGDRAGRHRINIDGVVIYDEDSTGKSTECTQVFRLGRVESITTAAFSRPLAGGPLYFRADACVKAIAKHVTKLRKTLAHFGVDEPVVVAVAAIGAKGAWVPHDGRLPAGHPIDRDVLLPPDVLFENREDKEHEILRPIFESLWNACGLSYRS